MAECDYRWQDLPWSVFVLLEIAIASLLLLGLLLADQGDAQD